MEKTYFTFHVRINEKYGYSVSVESDKKLDVETDRDEIIDIAVKNNLLEEEGDKFGVDSIQEITEDEYKKFYSL